MWRVKGQRILVAWIIVILCAGTCDLQGAGGQNVDYDADFEIMDNDAPRKEDSFVQDAAVEMTISYCQTRDSTRICDCGFQNQDLTFPTFAGNLHQMVIRNCKRIVIRPETFANIHGLLHLDFENIEDLVLHSNSLSFPIGHQRRDVNIRMQNVRVDSIPAHAISGFVESWSIQNSAVGTLERFAVNGIRSTVRELLIADTTINQSEPYTFKKFTVESVAFKNLTSRSAIPSKFFYGIEVRSSFTMINCNLSAIQSSAFDMQDVSSLQLLGNEIQELSGEAFRMALLNGANIEHNRIPNCHPAAFRSLSIAANYWRHHNLPMPFLMKFNTIGTMNIAAPIILSEHFQPNIIDLRYLHPLTCEDVERLRENDFFRTYKDSILFRMHDKLLNDDKLTEEETFYPLSHIFTEFCISRNLFWYYILIGSSVLLIILLLILITLCVWYRRRKAQKMSLIMPDGRTYRETTIVMQIENHNLLKTDL